jgi:poly(beta-D-mannuronate) lyase
MTTLCPIDLPRHTWLTTAWQFKCFVMIAMIVAAPGRAAEYMVSNASQIAALRTTVQPGDTLVMSDGVWTNQRIDFSGFGSTAQPITLRPQTPGGVVLNGNSKIRISGDWLVVDGLKFDAGALVADDHVVEFRGQNGEATNSRFTNSAIINYNPTDVDTRYFWVSLYGQNNRVDHNRFEGQNHSGVTVTVWRDNGVSDHHLIDGNHFVDRPAPDNPSDPNGFETIRIGTSDDSLSDSYTVVENNLFERLDGEIEIISNKSGHNTYRYNTFRESAGTLTLRHGNDTRVESNFFLGDNKSNSGAIRVIGERQTIVNNYIASVDDRAGGAISISAAVPNSPLSGYYQVKDATIAHNTIINTSGVMLTFDDGLGSSGRTLLAENVTVANNIFRSSGPAIFEGNEGANWTWEGNIAFGGNLGPKSGDAGITVVDPQLQLDANNVWRLGSNSPARDSSVGIYSTFINDDFDGQPRIGLFDVGADEYSTATIVRKPLSAGDVGPTWLLDENPPGGSGPGCYATGCAIQAEDFASLLDPNSNGSSWNVFVDSEALGGEALQAPNGSRIDLPGHIHDAIAVYDVTFEQAGTYRAYYRAKGNNGSSDSIYVPDGFNVDPDNSKSISQDGIYSWTNGSLFTISPSNVGVPLEFRIGKREELAFFDALVLELDQSMTAAELDALFAIDYAASDFNQDGNVDGLDLLIWQQHYGDTGANLALLGDADVDNDVDGRDFLIWQREFSPAAPLVSSVVDIPEPTCAMLLVGAMAIMCSLRSVT